MNCTRTILWTACLCLALRALAEGPKLADGKPRKFSREIRLTDVLNHKWADELVTYALDFPERQATLDSIRLYDADGGKEVPFQLSGVVFHDEKRQFVKSATIAFFVDELPANGTRRYAVLWDPGTFASAAQPAAALMSSAKAQCRSCRHLRASPAPPTARSAKSTWSSGGSGPATSCSR